MATVLSQRVFSPTVLLYSFVVVSQFALGLYFGLNTEPPVAFTVLQTLAQIWIIGWWLLSDSRKQGVAWIYDSGLFIQIGWPILMTYYLVKTRRAKALLVMLGFIGAYIGATVAGAFVSMIVATMKGQQ